MTTLYFKLKEQLLVKQNEEIIASGDANTDKCVFEFDESWDGYMKTAVFYQDKERTYMCVLENDDSCMIPAEAMAREGTLYIGVFGIDGSKVLTSTLETTYIEDSGISGVDVSTEPSDDIFLSIIAQYQRVAEQMRQYEETAKQFNETMAEQNALLETLNAFEVAEISERLDAIEDRMISYNNIANEIMNREIVIRNVAITFDENRTFRLEHSSITSSSLCDVYFDEYSYEIASGALIMATSYDGYLELNSAVDIDEELKANILVRRY